MYYVGAYGDEDVNGHMQYRYVGFSKNKEAMRILLVSQFYYQLKFLISYP